MFDLTWTEGIILGVVIIGIQWYLSYRSFVSEKEKEAVQLKTESQFEDIKKHIDDRFESLEEVIDERVTSLETRIENLDTKAKESPLTPWELAP